MINKDICNETINLGSGRGYSVNDVLAFLKIISKVDFKVEYKNARPVDVSNMDFRCRENEADRRCDFDTNVGWYFFIL